MFEPILRALNESGTRYVLVGGFATVLHGHARMTADIDVIVDLARLPAERVIVALGKLGLVPRAPVPALAFADESARRAWIDEKGVRVFSMWDPQNPMVEVDLFVDHPVDFEELWARSVAFDVRGDRVRVVSIDDLIRLKRLADRPQDRDDIRALEAIARHKRGTPP